MHCGHYLDFIVQIDSNRLLSKANSKLLMINSENYNITKSKEVEIRYGARAATIVEGDKVFISFKNRVVAIYDTNNLKHLSTKGTGHDVVRKFVPLITNDETRLMVMTVGIELQIMNTATY